MVSEQDIRRLAYVPGEGSDFEVDFGFASGWFKISGDAAKLSDRYLAAAVNRSMKRDGYKFPRGGPREI